MFTPDLFSCIEATEAEEVQFVAASPAYQRNMLHF